MACKSSLKAKVFIKLDNENLSGLAFKQRSKLTKESEIFFSKFHIHLKNIMMRSIVYFLIFVNNNFGADA